MPMPNFRRDAAAPREFAIDDDVFQCAPRLPAGVAQTFGRMAQAPAEEQFAYLGEVLDILMLPASAARFAERMKDPTNPIDLDQIGDVFQWLMQEYSGRPTQQPSSSSESPTSTGTSSMDTAPPVEVTL